MFFQITYLCKPFLAMVTLEWAAAVMLTVVVPNVAGLLESYVAAFI
tara:strand:- start:118 stop:255 length:138 start_codon:yes stop_codon:yes gene_type:complete